MALSPNTTVAHYTVISKIGAGGMGEVYRAIDTRLDREVAIKVLPSNFAGDPDRLKRFEQEARATSALNHPNILTVYDIGTHDGSPYLVAELLQGEELREHLNRGPIPLRKALDYAQQISKGLAAAHERGITHRDLKPENLFITTDGRVKILDFGLAKLRARSDEALSSEIATEKQITDPGTVMGTVGYMSPEQLRGKPADHRSDIFSFGAILYEMISGRRAFRGESAADTISAILREEPPDLSGTNPTINPALERVINHCLEKNPQERFHSARDLAFAVEALSGPLTSGSTSTLLASLPTKRKSWAIVPWSVAAILLISTVILAWLYSRPTPVVSRKVTFVMPMPRDTVEVTSPVISPDGRRLAFVQISAGKRVLYVQPLDSLEGQPLSGTGDASYPFWSPDSRFLGFFSNNKLKKIDANGGAVQTLCDVSSPYGGTWNTNGDILISFDVKGIHRVSASGGVPTRLLNLDESRNELAQAWPTFLPDGKHFLYQSWNGRTDDSAIILATLDGTIRKLLTKADSSPLYAPPGYLLVTRGSVLIAQSFDKRKLELTGEPFPVAEDIGFNSSNSYANASVSEDGALIYLGGGVAQRQLVWFDRGGKRLDALENSELINDIVLSRDGKRLAIQKINDGNSDIWLADLERGVSSRFTFDKTIEDNPVWSPDGKTIVFSSGGTGLNVPLDLFQKAATGIGTPELVLKTGTSIEATDWSKDGRFILFQTYTPETNSDLWVLPLFGDKKPFPLLQTEFEEGHGHFSPDGHWFAYDSNETGRLEVYVQSFPQSGGKWLVSNGGGAQPHWRGDGKELFYIAPDKTLMSVDVHASGTFQTTAPKALFPTLVSGYEAPNRYVVTADGQRFLINSRATNAGIAPIIVILNWSHGVNR